MQRRQFLATVIGALGIAQLPVTRDMVRPPDPPYTVRPLTFQDVPFMMDANAPASSLYFVNPRLLRGEYDAL